MKNYETIHGSSNLAAATYDETTKTLSVRFIGGTEGEYSGVPPVSYSEFAKTFREGVSAGKFFHLWIKTNPKYKYKQTVSVCRECKKPYDLTGENEKLCPVCKAKQEATN